jgi:hypothetical protein
MTRLPTLAVLRVGQQPPSEGEPQSISPLEGEMPGRAEGGVMHITYS